ncbi:MAG TPA: DUF4249 domain-containing protein [Chryseolinea sp.]
MAIKRYNLIFLLPALIFFGCLDPYSAPHVKGNVDLLVVDGFLSATSSSIVVRLSHAMALDSAGTPPPELKATVQLEEQEGASVPLSGTADGDYTATGLNLDLTKQYRLHIKTLTGKEYFSDYVEVMKTPDIDSVAWRAGNQNLTIYVNTHDASGKAKYYYWDYVETYEHHAPFPAGYIMRKHEPIPLTLAERVDHCWTTQPSTHIFVASSENLSADAIRNFPLITLPAGGIEVSIRYSVLVRQRAISKEAYTFWTQLQKTTESLGGLFDPMPSQVVGNVHSTSNSQEPVLGFFSAGEERQERIYIRHDELPEEIRLYPHYFCPPDSIPISVVKTLPDNTLLVYPFGFAAPVGYVSSTSVCMDCRTLGGVTQKPDFW